MKKCCKEESERAVRESKCVKWEDDVYCPCQECAKAIRDIISELEAKIAEYHDALEGKKHRIYELEAEVSRWKANCKAPTPREVALEAENTRLKERHTMSANADKVMEYVEKLEAENAELKKHTTSIMESSNMSQGVSDNRFKQGLEWMKRAKRLEAELTEARKLNEHFRSIGHDKTEKYIKELQVQLDEARKKENDEVGYRLGLRVKNNELQAQVERLEKESARRRNEARLFYNADGSFKIYNTAEEVKQKRIESAKLIEKLTKENENLRSKWERHSYGVADSHLKLAVSSLKDIACLGEQTYKGTLASIRSIANKALAEIKHE